MNLLIHAAARIALAAALLGAGYLTQHQPCATDTECGCTDDCLSDAEPNDD